MDIHILGSKFKLLYSQDSSNSLHGKANGMQRAEINCETFLHFIKTRKRFFKLTAWEGKWDAKGTDKL